MSHRKKVPVEADCGLLGGRSFRAPPGKGGAYVSVEKDGEMKDYCYPTTVEATTRICYDSQNRGRTSNGEFTFVIQNAGV